ncbi:hypothetical protein AB1L42_20465 [Thalassoglobus sp. JC818]|uniref:hypothetical protein n=1 Tax=Thalassoglobus sp. JC818 TaxID=3232136 RepID=UPI003457ED19
MRSCQSCAAPIPTSAQTCPSCGAVQADLIGLNSVSGPPLTQDVAHENEKRDQQVARFGLMVLLGGAGCCAFVSGISFSSVLLGGSVFFVALIVIFIALQIIGIDVGA